jgi:hypothetical protein
MSWVKEITDFTQIPNLGNHTSQTVIARPHYWNECLSFDF